MARSKRKRPARIVALMLTLLIGSTGVAAGDFVQLGDFKLTVDGGFKPKRLPERKLAPISLHLEADFEMVDGTRPPALESIVLDFDKNGSVYTKGLPTCSTAELENAITADALARCDDALVGRGTTIAMVDLPDQEPFDASGPLLAFNGEPQGPDPVVIFHVFAHVPEPTTFVVSAPITDAPGNRFGQRVATSVPPIAGGNGSLTHVEITVERTWRHRGKKRSYVSARCETGSLVTGGKLTFADGTIIEGSIDRACRSLG